MGVTPHASVQAFFHEVVSEAIERRAVRASEDAEYYLVMLLGEFLRQPISDEPLSLKLATTEPAERVKALKEVGDTSLYLSGFFSESLRRKVVRADFYMSLGRAAYHELADRLAASRGARAVYHELSDGFPGFVEVLAEVSHQVSFDVGDVGKLYEKWLDTKAEWIERRLRAFGMMIPGANDTDRSH